MKPGGRVALVDIFGGVAGYGEVLQEAGMTDIVMKWTRGSLVFGVRTLVAKKTGFRSGSDRGVY